MTKEQYYDAAADCASMLTTLNECRDAANPTSDGHLAFMCGEIVRLAYQNRFEKASRWLGFVQGVLVAQGRLSLEQAKRANMPAGAEFDGERI